MKKTAAILLFVLLALGLGACRAQATPSPTAAPPSPTVTPAPPTSTPSPSATPTPSLTPTPAGPTATPLPPTNAPDCTNKASFVADVTIPDNTLIAPGQTFTKTWRVKNVGTCAWTTGYTLDYYSQDRLGFTAPVPLPLTLPGETVEISVVLTAPEQIGAYQANFVLKSDQGLIMAVDDDSRLWVVIEVSNQAPTPTLTPAETATPSPTPLPTDEGAAAPTVTPTAGAAEIPPPACEISLDPARLAEMVTAWNEYRAQNDLPPLTEDERLSAAAQRHANDMACNRFFSHTGTDGSTPASRVADAGYPASIVNENVYGSYPPLDGGSVVEWWAADTTDPRHNENLLTTQHLHYGVGYAYYNNFGYYVLVLAAP